MSMVYALEVEGIRPPRVLLDPSRAFDYTGSIWSVCTNSSFKAHSDFLPDPVRIKDHELSKNCKSQAQLHLKSKSSCKELWHRYGLIYIISGQ